VNCEDTQTQHKMDVLTIFLKLYGWYVVGALIMFVVVQNQIREYLLRREKRRSLESANDPTRLSVLDRERRRVRETQQKMYEEHVQKTKKKKRRVVKKSEEERRIDPTPTSTSFNHLLSSSTSSSYRPRRRRRAGRG